MATIKVVTVDSVKIELDNIPFPLIVAVTVDSVEIEDSNLPLARSDPETVELELIDDNKRPLAEIDHETIDSVEIEVDRPPPLTGQSKEKAKRGWNMAYTRVNTILNLTLPTDAIAPCLTLIPNPSRSIIGLQVSQLSNIFTCP